MFNEKVARQVQQVKPKFDIPKARIPQSQIIREPAMEVSFPVTKNRLTVKTYLQSTVVRKRCKTSLWGSKKVSARDSASYVNSLQRLRTQVLKKRERKEFFRNLRLQMEKQKLVQRRDNFDYHQQLKQNFYGYEEIPVRSYPKASEPQVEKGSYSKASTEPGSNSTLYRDDSSKAIEEAELKSTAISCYEKVAHKDIGSKTYGDLGYNDYQVDQEIPQPAHQPPNKVSIDDLHHSESLLDKIFEDHNQEFSDEFMKESLHYD